MPSTTTRIEECLLEATMQAFERMCFAAVEPADETISLESAIQGAVRFAGDAAGYLRLSMSPESLQMVAASFLGEDESTLSTDQMHEVITELANVICGSMLSLFSATGHFALCADSGKIGETDNADAILNQAFQGDAGAFTIELGIDRLVHGS